MTNHGLFDTSHAEQLRPFFWSAAWTMCCRKVAHMTMTWAKKHTLPWQVNQLWELQGRRVRKVLPKAMWRSGNMHGHQKKMPNILQVQPLQRYHLDGHAPTPGHKKQLCACGSPAVRGCALRVGLQEPQLLLGLVLSNCLSTLCLQHSETT